MSNTLTLTVPCLELEGDLAGDVNSSDYYAATVVIICADGSKQLLNMVFAATAKPKRVRLSIAAGREAR